MLKKTITWTGFNGQEVSKDFYFHLSEANILKYELLTPGGDFAAHMQKVAENTANEPKALIDLFEDLIAKSYGERGADDVFYQSEEISKRFQTTPAYSRLFFDLCTQTEQAEEFVNGIIPASITEQLKAGVRPPMQDHLPKRPTSTVEVLPTFRDDEITEPPAPVDDEYEEFQEWKRQQAEKGL